MNDIQLRPWLRQDAQQLAAIANNKNIWNNVRDSFPSPYTVMDALQWISKEAGSQTLTNFAVLYQGSVAGSMGIILNEDVYRNTVEIGYFIGEPFWGKGIATAAVNSLCSYVEQRFKPTRIMARIYAHNKASMKVLEKNGFELESVQRKAAIKNGVVLDVYVWVKFP